MTSSLRLASPILIVGLCVIASSCQSPAPVPLPQWEGVAAVGGTDRVAQMHVEGLLKRNGIDSLIEGSLLYGVAVPPRDAARARELLRRDVRERPYYITILDGDKREDHTASPDAWVVVSPRERCDAMLLSQAYSAETDLGAALRHPDVREAAHTFPWVMQVRSFEQAYFDEGGKARTGHQFELELAAKLDDHIGGTRFWIEAWGGGRGVMMIGSNGWWTGDEAARKGNGAAYDKGSN
jgi:hypothetical protein